jgi:hypothetical protein
MLIDIEYAPVLIECGATPPAGFLKIDSALSCCRFCQLKGGCVFVDRYAYDYAIPIKAVPIREVNALRFLSLAENS